MMPLTNHHFQWRFSEVSIIDPYVCLYDLHDLPYAPVCRGCLPNRHYHFIHFVSFLFIELRGRVKPQHQQLPFQLSLLQCSTSGHIGWLLGGGVLDLARRGEAESRDATLAAVVRKGLDPLFGLDPAFCLRCAVSKVGPQNQKAGKTFETSPKLTIVDSSAVRNLSD